MGKFYIGSIFLLTSSVAIAGWGLKDLDPTNKNSGVRKATRKLDPSQWIKTNPGKNLLMHMGKEVTSSDEFKSKAESEGWTMQKCRTAGVGISAAVAGFKGAAICAAYVAGEPLSTTACVGLVMASGSTITEIACTQACHDRILRDCK